MSNEMYSKQIELRDKTTEVVDFCYSRGLFTYQGIDFQIYPDRKNPNTPDIAIKRNDTTPHKRLSGLFVDGARLKGDIRTSTQKRYFQLEVSEDKKHITLIGFKEAISLIGINTPVEQNNLFTGHYSTLERGLSCIGATGINHQLNIASEPIN